MSHLMSHDAPAVTIKDRIAGAGRGLAAIVLRKVLAAMEKGRLTFILPDGERVDCRGPLAGPEARHEMGRYA